MTAYIVSMMTIHDRDTYRKYTDRTPPTVKRHGGRFLTRGQDVVTLEGDQCSTRMVLLEFPSMQHINAWMADPDYVEAVKFRHASSTAQIFAQCGSENTQDPNPLL